MYQDYSRNKKVNPFVGELKKSLQKQADIIVRKAMGKMSDKSYETFLKKHKQTILDNSTKTYLSKFLPESVLKSVGGRKVIEDGKVVGFIPNYVPHSVWGEKGVKLRRVNYNLQYHSSGWARRSHLPDLEQVLRATAATTVHLRAIRKRKSRIMDAQHQSRQL